MTDRPKLGVSGTVLSTPDAGALASFYERLLGWSRLMDEDGWVVIAPEGARTGALSFHVDEAYEAPVWPSQAGEQQMQVHLDIGTDDLDAAIGWAIGCGASRHRHQPQDGVVVMVDPDGHPFCLFVSSRI
jgi:catechol 2,3-dioxygenase-like lactoylglutathione lyase family enzyme